LPSRCKTRRSVRSGNLIQKFPHQLFDWVGPGFGSLPDADREHRHRIDRKSTNYNGRSVFFHRTWVTIDRPSTVCTRLGGAFWDRRFIEVNNPTNE
jgi:hypothetical protein